MNWTDLVGGISILHDSVSTDNDTVNVIMLHQRTEHGVAYSSAVGHDGQDDLQIMVAGICKVVNSNEVRREPTGQLRIQQGDI